jgi:hypothetical protein
MRNGLLIGAGLAAMLALPAAADGYSYSSAPATTHTYNTRTTASSGCATSCCCGQTVRTYTTRPVVRRYVQTYTQTAPPACTHTSHVGTGHVGHDHAHYSGGYDYQDSASSYSSGTVTSGYASDGGYSVYSDEDSGYAYYDDGYYAEDDAYDDAYLAPAPAYGAELSRDREAPWNGYHR